jgi:hypothetical protein
MEDYVVLSDLHCTVRYQISYIEQQYEFRALCSQKTDTLKAA